MRRFMVNHFPSTISLQTVDKRYDDLQQEEGESVSAFWTRFQDWMVDAEHVGYNFNEVTGFVKRLFNTFIKNHIQNEINRFLLAGKQLSIDKVTKMAIVVDSQRNLNQKAKKPPHHHNQRQKESTNATSEEPRNKNKKRKSDEHASGDSKKSRSDTKCYNCNTYGHRFGNMENPICTAPISKETREYFEKKASKAKAE